MSVTMLKWAAASFMVVAACAGSPDASQTGSTEQSVWSNGDFENDPIGTEPPTGWTLNTYENESITDTRPNPQTLESLNLSPGGTPMTFVIGGAPESQIDPDVGTAGTLRYPKYGQRAARLNYQDSDNDGDNLNINSLKQQMTVALGDVDPTDNKVHVRFASRRCSRTPATRTPRSRITSFGCKT